MYQKLISSLTKVKMENKEIIGYKLVKEEYKKAAENLIDANLV